MTQFADDPQQRDVRTYHQTRPVHNMPPQAPEGAIDAPKTVADVRPEPYGLPDSCVVVAQKREVHHTHCAPHPQV